jgi:hypothetical protein
MWYFDTVSVPNLHHEERLLIATKSIQGIQQEQLYLPSAPHYLGWIFYCAFSFWIFENKSCFT